MRPLLSLCLVAQFGLQAATGHAQCKAFEGDRGELNYQPRGAVPAERRCEGFTKLDMAALEGEVVSITRGRPSYYSTAKEVIMISAPASTDASVLECIGRARVGGGFYRLDMELAPGETKLIPVKDVLLAGGIKNDHLGVTLRRANTEDTFLPVVVSSRMRNGAVGAADSLFIKFLPRILLRDLQVVVYEPTSRQELYSGAVKGLLMNDSEVQVGVPITRLGLTPDKERTVLVQLKSKAENGGPLLDRSFQVQFPKE